jgi:RNA polymerase sigma-70 factor (ECF subfamily)
VIDEVPEQADGAQPEAEVMRRCRDGDRDAFGQIVKRYAGRAIGAALLLLGDHDEAQDASQEAFVRAWRNIRKFDPSRRFFPWYGTILRNICISRLRRRSGKRTVELLDGASGTPPEAGPVLLAERNERKDRIWRAIRQLSETQREVIVMNHFQEMSYREMAEALDIPLGTVMSRLHNARAALRKRLANEAHEL